MHAPEAVLRRVTVTSTVPAAADVPSIAGTSAALRHRTGPEVVVLVVEGTVVDGTVVEGEVVEGAVLRAAADGPRPPEEQAASTKPATTRPTPQAA